MKPWLRLALITLTVGGGFTGIVVTAQALFNAQNQTPLLLMGLFLALFTFVTVSGLLFVHDPEQKRPLIVALAIQIPWISSSLVVYKFAAGFHAVLGLGIVQAALRIDSDIQLGSGWRFSLFQPSACSVGINVFPLLILVLLLRSLRSPRSAVLLTAPAAQQRDSSALTPN